jgi:hypothetical protein
MHDSIAYTGECFTMTTTMEYLILVSLIGFLRGVDTARFYLKT